MKLNSVIFSDEKDDSIMDWDNVNPEDIKVILDAATTGDVTKLKVKHYLILEAHKDKFDMSVAEYKIKNK